MGWIHGVTKALFDSRLAETEARLKNSEAIVEHLHDRLATAHKNVALEESIREAVVRENKQIKTRNEQLIAENMDLTKRFVVPDVLRRAKPWFNDVFSHPVGRTVTGRYGCSPAACVLDMDFSVLEQRVAASVIAQTKPKPRKKRLFWSDLTVNKQYIYIYCSHHEQGQRAGHFGRFFNDEVGRKYADQYVKFLNSLE